MRWSKWKEIKHKLNERKNKNQVGWGTEGGIINTNVKITGGGRNSQNFSFVLKLMLKRFHCPKLYPFRSYLTFCTITYSYHLCKTRGKTHWASPSLKLNGCLLFLDCSDEKEVGWKGCESAPHESPLALSHGLLSQPLLTEHNSLSELCNASQTSQCPRYLRSPTL